MLEFDQVSMVTVTHEDRGAEKALFQGLPAFLDDKGWVVVVIRGPV